MSIRMTETEAWAKIAAAHTGILTTLRADGSPITLPMWFVVADRTVRFTTFEGTKKLARVRHDPRASFLVESGERWVDLCAVHVSGLIHEVFDEDEKLAIDAAMDAKYSAFRPDRSTMPEKTRDVYATKHFLELVPTGRLLTWDNSRIALQDPS